MANLTQANLQTSFNGHLWLNTNCQKTDVETNIRLLDNYKAAIPPDTMYKLGAIGIVSMRIQRKFTLMIGEPTLSGFVNVG